MAVGYQAEINVIRRHSRVILVVTPFNPEVLVMLRAFRLSVFLCSKCLILPGLLVSSFGRKGGGIRFRKRLSTPFLPRYSLEDFPMRASPLSLWLLACSVVLCGCGDEPKGDVKQTSAQKRFFGRWQQESQEADKRVELVLRPDGSGSWTVGNEETAFTYDPQRIDLSPEPVDITEEAADGPQLRAYLPDARISVTFVKDGEAEYRSKPALFVKFVDADHIEVMAKGPHEELLPAWRLVTPPIILRRLARTEPSDIAAGKEKVNHKSPQPQDSVEAAENADTSDARRPSADESKSGQIIAGDAPKDELVKKELERLQGVWSAQSVDIAGAPEELLDAPKNMKVTFEGSEVTLTAQHEGRKPVFQKTVFRLDPCTIPKEITLAATEAENGRPAIPASPGIYEMDGDTLKLCLAPYHGEERFDPETGEVVEKKSFAGKRPTAFDPKQGILLVLIRKKP